MARARTTRARTTQARSTSIIMEVTIRGQQQLDGFSLDDNEAKRASVKPLKVEEHQFFDSLEMRFRSKTLL